MAIIILLTITFNLIILVTIVTKPEIRKRGSNWWCFIISLCIADLTVAIAVMPFRLVLHNFLIYIVKDILFAIAAMSLQ